MDDGPTNALNRSAQMQHDGRIDFRALVEANQERVDAAGALSRVEAPMVFGPPPDGSAPDAWEEEKERWESGRKQELADARDRRAEAETRFLWIKEGFEEANGSIQDYYYSRTVKDAGAALTTRFVVKGNSLLAVMLSLVLPARTEPWIQLHVHNLVLFDLPDEPAFVSLRVGFAGLLHRIDAKHLSAQFMLRGLSRHVLIRRLFALRRDMLADLDKAREGLGYSADRAASALSGHSLSAREKAVGARLTQSLSGYEQEFSSISRTYGQAAKREARIIYLSGMLVGLVLLALFSLVLGLLLWAANLPIDLDTFLTCLAAGAIGAFVSVLQRMSAGKFTVNHEVGREYVQRLAYFRPFIGSIFGLAVFFALEGGLANVTPPQDSTQRYAFFAFTAFLAGFSERFAKEMLGSPSGADTEESDLDESSELGSAGKRFAELAGADGDKEVVVETTRASSRPAKG